MEKYYTEEETANWGGWNVTNREQKLCINLSRNARSVIAYDMQVFHCTSRAGFLNNVFQKYYALAEASICKACGHRKDELASLLREIEDGTTKDAIIQKMVIQYQMELVDKVEAYGKGDNTEIIRLQNETLDQLVNSNEADSYQGYAGRYFKAVIEEYCTKTTYEREEIYLQERHQIIQSAIKDAKELRLCLRTGENVWVRPYKICADDQFNYHYLVGLSRPNDRSGPWREFSHRVADLKKVAPSQYHSHISGDEKKRLEEKLKKNGPQFMSDETAETIKVRFTEEGLKKYRRIQHLRPCERKEDAKASACSCIKEFTCTRRQAEFYFDRFGADAVILEPKDLAEHLLKYYRAAAEAYAPTEFRE
ncbi:MAG: WYL domain-containing protein [Faecousia sp.]